MGLVLASVLVFSGCGGGSDGGVVVETPPETETPIEVPATLVTGQFIDAPVQGLSYECTSGMSGVTDAAGSFTCKEGDDVTFKVGSTVIGTSKAKEIVTPLHLHTNIEHAYNAVQLLHSLDTDANPDNGISIDSVLDLGSIDITSGDFENTLASVFATNGKAVYNREQAQAKMYNYLEQNPNVNVADLSLDISTSLASLETLMCSSSQKTSQRRVPS